MSLTSYRAAPPRGGDVFGVGCLWGRVGGPGGDLLSRALRHSTMGAGEFHGRVRDGIGCRLPAMATRSSNPPCGETGCDRGSGWCCVCASRIPEAGDKHIRKDECGGHIREDEYDDLGMISMHGVEVSSRSGD